MKLVKSTVAACLALALGSGAGVAGAAALVFDDTAADDTITISVNDFESGFSVNGNLIQLGLHNPGSITLPEGRIAFLGRWIDSGLSGEGGRTIFLVEAQDPHVVSDILDYNWSTDGHIGTIRGTFTSDSEGGLGTIPINANPNDVFVEDGQPVPFSLPFLGGEIRSDVDAVVVPEPGTLALLGLGLLPLGWASRRKRG